MDEKSFNLAVQRAIQAESEGRAVLYVRNGELVDSAAFSATRSNLKQQFESALKGQGADDRTLAQIYGQSTTAYACTQYRCDTVAAIPLTVKDPYQNKVDYHPFSYFIQSAPILLWHIEAGLIIYGKSYTRKNYNAAGYPTGLTWINPQLIKHDPKLFGGRGGWVISDGNERETLKENEIIPFHNFDPSGATNDGLSDYEVALSDIATERGMTQYTAAFFMNQARPDGMLISNTTLDVDSDEYKQFKKNWKRFESAENAFKTFITGGEWQYIPLSPPIADIAMTDVDAKITKDICKVMKVDPALIGGADVADPLSAENTFKNKVKAHILSVSIPRLTHHILATLNKHWAWKDFNQKNYYTLSVNQPEIAVLSETTIDNVQTAQIIIESGLGTFDEGRKVADLPPLGDAYISRNPRHLIELLQSSGVTFNQLREYLGIETLDTDYILVNGQIIPKDRLFDVASANAENIISGGGNQDPFGGQFPMMLTNLTEIIRTLSNSARSFVQLDPIHVLPEPSTTVDTTRAIERAALVFPLGEHPYIETLTRQIDRQLSQAGITAIQWVNPRNWQAGLIRFSALSATEAAGLIRALQLEESARIETVIADIIVSDGAISLSVETTDELKKLQNASATELRGLNLETQIAPPQITLAYVGEQVPENLLTIEPFPLTLNALALQLDSELAHTWQLRTASKSELTEMKNWRLRVRKHKPTIKHPIAPFTLRALVNTRAANWVSWALALGCESESVFDVAQDWLRGDFKPPVTRAGELTTPEEYEAYWGRFDAIRQELRHSWLNGYMAKAWDNVRSSLGGGDVNAVDIDGALRANHDSLTQEWLGSLDDLGVLPRLILAGQAAGNQALLDNMPADYRAAFKRAGVFGQVNISWELANEAAYNFAQQYAFDLIRRLDKQTSNQVRGIISEWVLEQGATLDDLTERLTPVFDNESRARTVANTESIRMYNAGVEERWRQTGVTQARWMTVRDKDVCPICEQLRGQTSEFATGWEHQGGVARNEETGQAVNAEKYKGNIYKPPAHPNCRCFEKPIIPDVVTLDLSDYGGNPPNGGENQADRATNDDPEPSPDSELRAKRVAMRVRDAIKDSQKELSAIRSKMESSRLLIEKEYADEFKAANEEYLRVWGDVSQKDSNASKLLDIEDAYFAKRKEWLNALAGKDPNEDKIHQELADIKAERARLEKIRSEAAQEVDLIRTAIADGVNKQTRDLLRYGAKPKITWEQTRYLKKFDGMQDRYTQAQDFINDVVNGDLYQLPVNIKAGTTNGRAFQEPEGGGDSSIHLSPVDGTKIWVHEIGHAIEEGDPHIHKRCVDFLRERTEGERPQRLKSLTGINYAANEIAWKDNFYDPYVGKIYGVESNLIGTEILSMGLEYLYYNPEEFARVDPEFFDFIVGILRGLF